MDFIRNLRVLYDFYFLLPNYLTYRIQWIQRAIKSSINLKTRYQISYRLGNFFFLWDSRQGSYTRKFIHPSGMRVARYFNILLTSVHQIFWVFCDLIWFYYLLLLFTFFQYINIKHKFSTLLIMNKKNNTKQSGSTYLPLLLETSPW